MTYSALDYIQEPIPRGFDRILYCDAGPYEVELFRQMRRALLPGGRLIVVDQFSPSRGIAPPSRLAWAFLGSLENPDSQGFTTAESLISKLEEAGFRKISVADVPCARKMRWESDWQAIEACA